MADTLNLFFGSVLLGLSIAAPVGPIGLLCIRRTLAHGRITGMISGLGAASADAIYGLVAGLGLTAISGLLVGYRDLLAVLGGLFLCYLGGRTMLAAPAGEDSKTTNHKSGLLGAYTSTLFLTLTNPATILTFVAIFTGLDMVDADSGASTVVGLPASLIVLGVFSGSALWWLVLSTGVSIFRGYLNANGMRWINRIAGIMIAGFGVYALVSGVF